MLWSKPVVVFELKRVPYRRENLRSLSLTNQVGHFLKWSRLLVWKRPFPTISLQPSKFTPKPNGLIHQAPLRRDQPSTLFNSGEEITVRLTITNQSDSQQKIIYSTSQRIKAVVTARNDNQVLFDFDSAFLYAQVISEQSLTPDQSVSFETDFNSNQLGAGEYNLKSAMALFDIDHDTLLDGTDSQYEDDIDFEVQ